MLLKRMTLCVVGAAFSCYSGGCGVPPPCFSHRPGFYLSGQFLGGDACPVADVTGLLEFKLRNDPVTSLEGRQDVSMDATGHFQTVISSFPHYVHPSLGCGGATSSDWYAAMDLERVEFTIETGGSSDTVVIDITEDMVVSTSNFAEFDVALGTMVLELSACAENGSETEE